MKLSGPQSWSLEGDGTKEHNFGTKISEPQYPVGTPPKFSTFSRFLTVSFSSPDGEMGVDNNSRKS